MKLDAKTIAAIERDLDWGGVVEISAARGGLIYVKSYPDRADFDLPFAVQLPRTLHGISFLRLSTVDRSGAPLILSESRLEGNYWVMGIKGSNSPKGLQ